MPEMMVSTEDPNLLPVSFRTVTVDGSAPRGALYTPGSFTELDLRQLAGLNYPDLHSIVNGVFVGNEIPSETQREMARESYSPENFREQENGYIGRLVELYPNLYYKNLSAGKTRSFKDNAMETISSQTEYFLEELKEKRVVVMATTGDTGPAAESANQGSKNSVSFCLVPEKGPVYAQKGQMGRLTDNETIFNIEIDGDFTECQDMVIELNKMFDNLGAVNSINFARVASQVVYYFSTYFQVIEQSGGKIGDPVNFAVPSGNAGNILAAYLAKRMGLPINKLIAATNVNDSMHTIISNGIFIMPEKDKETYSPSMNIRMPNNFMRILFYLSGMDQQTVVDYKRRIKKYGRVAFEDVGLPQDLMFQAGFASDTCGNSETVKTIHDVYVDTDGEEIIDPHGATAVYAARRYMAQNGSDIPTVVMGTAEWSKFSATTRKALPKGVKIELPDDMKEAEEWGRSGKGYIKLKKDINAVTAFILANVSTEFRESMRK